jgi:hypothetical protein
MARLVLKERLAQWVKDKEQNGIRQHDPGWDLARLRRIGGSSLGTIQGLNRFSNIGKLIGERIGIYKFVGGIPLQWGNLFEEVIKQFVEHDRGCEILGEDLYVECHSDMSYSPDGLAVMDIIDEYMFEEETYVDTPTGREKRVEMVVTEVPKTAIVLAEFKCPYSRLPNGAVPESYVSQVKMGLELLEVASVGLYAEGVFRRCTWEQLGNNPLFDRTLVPKSSGRLPLAYGIIGFYIDKVALDAYIAKTRVDPHKITPEQLIEKTRKLITEYKEHYVEAGNETNEYMSNDLGESPPDLFKLIMDAYDSKIIKVWYGKITPVDANIVSSNGKATPDDIAKKLEQLNIDSPQYTEEDGAQLANESLSAYTEFCTTNKYTNLGILPWKLFRVDYHFIQKENNYLKPWIPKIQEIIGVISKCLDPANASIKSNIFNSYINKSTSEGFSDQ